MPAHQTLVTTQVNVLKALILRDIRTRFFGHGLGYLVAIAWPMAHILILLAIYKGIGRLPPHGSSLGLWFATALVPVMTFMYASRWIMFSVVMNKSLLYFPIVRLADVLIARGILESACACCMALGVMGFLFLVGIDVIPAIPAEAMKAMGAAILLGLGMGFINGIVAVVWPLWATGYSLILIGLYILSGVLYVPDELPEKARQILAWNPVLHSAEWMRVAYFPSYHSRTLDKTFLISFGSGALFLALVLERYGRRLLLTSR